jgi:hypothetical protein
VVKGYQAKGDIKGGVKGVRPRTRVRVRSRVRIKDEIKNCEVKGDLNDDMKVMGEAKDFEVKYQGEGEIKDCEANDEVKGGLKVRPTFMRSRVV